MVNFTCRFLNTDIEDLGDILPKLKLVPKANGKWREFGLGLGLSYTTIENIEANNPKDVESCFRECLVHWLRREDNVDEKGLPTLSRLVEVLEEIGDKATAEKLREENKGNIHTLLFFQSLTNFFCSLAIGTSS